ncbi:unnamed protein product [Periconia digitata]|uniref:Uncharacterized protein n=1 Tax=Periconia digitata TaxID=1303443 RepID=A0A9W4UN35_9PLEO|nr:unnamed protein product [Periconia digitata]
MTIIIYYCHRDSHAVLISIILLLVTQRPLPIAMALHGDWPIRPHFVERSLSRSLLFLLCNPTRVSRSKIYSCNNM